MVYVAIRESEKMSEHLEYQAQINAETEIGALLYHKTPIVVPTEYFK